MSYSLVLNSSNNISPQNNQFKYNFISGNLKVPEGTEIGISQITIPYSWYNVTSQLGNNTFQYYIPNSSNVQTAYNVTLPNGFYGISDINNALQSTMKTNGHYWYSNLGTYSTQFQFVGAIATTTLTVSSTQSASVRLIIGTTISGYNVTSGTTITAQLTAYTYTVSVSQTVASSPMYASQSNEVTPTIIYPLSLSVYLPQYTNQITSITIPTNANIQNVLGSGFFYANGSDNQSNWNGGYPTTANQCAYISIPTTTSTTTTIGNLLGFTSGSYPSTNTGITSGRLQQNIYGNSLNDPVPFPVLATQVNGVIVRCNLVDNNIAMPSDVLDNFAINSPFGSNINYLPIADNAVKMKSGTFSSMIISFADQNYNPLIMNDPNVLISVLIRFPPK
jgi:hypothetical protein